MSNETISHPGSIPKHAPRRSNAAGRRACEQQRKPAPCPPDRLPAKVRPALRSPMPHLRTTLITMALLLLTGCGASRRAVRSDTATRSDTTSTRHISAVETALKHATTHARLSNDTQTVTHITEFDTSRPPDSSTGTPPVKRRIIRTQRAATQIAQATTAAAQTQTAAASETLTSGSTRSDTHTEEQTRRGMTSLQRTLCVAGVAALGWLALRLFVKLR